MAIATTSADHLQIPQAVEEHICVQCPTEKKPRDFQKLCPVVFRLRPWVAYGALYIWIIKLCMGFMISSKRVSSLSQMDSIMVNLGKQK